MGITSAFDGDTNADFQSTLSSYPKYEQYQHAITMRCADRNLDTIFRSERPGINTVGSYGQQIAEPEMGGHTYTSGGELEDRMRRGVGCIV